MATNLDIYYGSVAAALLRFSAAWNALTELTKKDSEMDLSLNYPFGYIDFEQLTEAVQIWAASNANALRENIHVMIINPDCIANCPNWQQAYLHPLDGSCSASEKSICTRDLMVAYDPIKIRTWLIQNNHADSLLQNDYEQVLRAYEQTISKLRS